MSGDRSSTAGNSAMPFHPRGAVGALIAARDWSASPLGPIGRWPRPLVAALNLMLATEVPTRLFWGPEHVLFYNDAYAALMEDRHPDAIGGRGQEEFAHAWPQLEPVLAHVRASGESMPKRDQARTTMRAGASVHGYFDVTFSPVHAEDGTVGGVLAIVFETTDRVRAMAAAVAQGERLAQMFRQAPSFMALLREPGHVYEFANDAYRRLVGGGAVIGRSVADALPEDVARRFVTRLDAVVASGEPYFGEGVAVELDPGDGAAAGRRLLDLIFQPIVEDDGRVTAVFIEGNDVTEYSRTQRQLALSESTLRLAIETAEIGTWDLDLATDTLDWSDRTKRMFGISPDRPCSMADFHAGLHPDDRDATVAAFTAALDPALHGTYDVEYRTIGKEDGIVRWVAARGRGIFEQGRCVRALGTALDITERKRAQEVLRESEQRFRSLADSAPALIWLCDEEGALVFANRWHEETFGRPLNDLLGGGWQDFLHSEDAAGFCEDFEFAFAARAPFSRDVRVVDRHGVARWLHSEARPRHTEGRFVGYVGCDVDITEVRLASEALERGIAERTSELAATNRQLSAQIEERERVETTLRQMQRLEAIGQLTSGVAHDFNNLLTVVLGNLDMVARQADAAGLDPRLLRRLDHMRAAAERGATLTGQLLAFSRRQRLEARTLDLNETVAGMRDLMQSSMGGSVRLETALQPELWPALVDPTQIELIILNLAINARDAMEVGGALTVSTANVVLGTPVYAEEPAPGEYVMIAVADSGTGMTPEVRAKAFEPFFTTKEVGKGSGLGLAQVYGFAKQSGGGVGIETEPGRGTIVRVYLPRAPERRRVPRPSGARRAEEPVADAAGRRVLLVDDDPPVREVTAGMLRAMRADVTEAGSGGAALELLAARGGAFDLMVVDFAMPGMNGAELAAAARARWPELPVLFVTGYADLTAIASVSADRIVQKPFRGGELQRKAAALLAANVG